MSSQSRTSAYTPPTGLARYGTYPPDCFLAFLVFLVFLVFLHSFLEILVGLFFLKVFERKTVILINKDNHPRRLHGIRKVVQEFAKLQAGETVNALQA